MKTFHFGSINFRVGLNFVKHRAYKRKTADLVTFTEEICNRKLHFLRSGISNFESSVDKMRDLINAFHED